MKINKPFRFAWLAIEIVSLICLISFNSFSQGFYLRAGLGYAIPQAGQTMDGTGMPYSGTSNNTVSPDSTKYTSYNISKISFSSGMHFTIAGGYMFNKNIGVDLSCSFGMYNTQYIYYDNNENVSGVPCNIQVIQQAQTPIMLMPTLVLQSGGEKFNFYSRTGLAIPLQTNIVQDQIFTNLPGTGTIETDDYTWQIKNSFSIGLTAAMGVQLKISDNFKFWCEASLLSLSVYINEADLTNVSANGQGNYLSQIPVDERKVTYSYNFNSVTGDVYHQPVYSQPFSNVAFNAGFIYLFPQEERSNNKVKRYQDEDHINRF